MGELTDRAEKLLSKLQPMWLTREGEAPADWWFMDYLERDMETRTPTLVVGEEWDTALTHIAARINKDDARPIIQALPQVPELIRELVAEVRRLDALAQPLPPRPEENQS